MTDMDTSDTAMADIGTRIHDLATVHAGDRIEVWQHGRLHYLASVEQAAPALEVVWVREIPGGFRKLVHTQDVELRHHTSDSV